jgi:hypothetical protein
MAWNRPPQVARVCAEGWHFIRAGGGRGIAMKRIKKPLIILAMFTVVLLISEIMANIFIYYYMGVEKEDYRTKYKGNPDLIVVDWLSAYTPHPYFGYEDRKIRAFERADIDSERQFVIGILGGSVAESLGGYFHGHRGMFEKLRLVIPSLGDKEIIIANLAMGGGRQPQQFFVSAYFIDDLDMIINVDGLNDVVGWHFLPVYPLEFPVTSLKYLQRTSSGEVYRSLARALKWTYVSIHKLPTEHFEPLSSSSLYFALWQAVHPILLSSIRHIEKKFIDSALHPDRSRVETEISLDALAEKRAKIWAKYTAMQYELIQGVHKKPVFLFIQPNQYNKGSKNFTEFEKNVAIDTAKIDRIHNALMILRNTASKLQRDGLPIYDLTNIFHDTQETVYTDSCCHLNSFGNEIMAKEVINAIMSHVENR